MNLSTTCYTMLLGMRDQLISIQMFSDQNTRCTVEVFEALRKGPMWPSKPSE